MSEAKAEVMRRSVNYERVIEHLRELKSQPRRERTISKAEIGQAITALRYYQKATLEMADEEEKKP